MNFSASSQLEHLRLRLREVESRLADPSHIDSPAAFAELGREHGDLQNAIALAERVVAAEERRSQAEELLAQGDEDFRELAKAELEEAGFLIESLTRELQMALLPPDPLDGRDLVLEIRAGTGGEEAALFAADLLRMYTRYAERQGWRMEPLSQTESDLGGFREVILQVSGAGAYSKLKHEGGTHRVQRVPETETQGRIHTSAATVAVLPVAEETDVEVKESDLRIDTMCASGPGGQGVNTTYSAVRIVHLPTGLIVQCQDERSQIKNKAKALTVLRARLLERKIAEEQAARSAQRKDMVGTGDRSGRIRTYNFPQNRVTDHRINLTLYNLDRVIQGFVDELIDALRNEELRERLEALAR